MTHETLHAAPLEIERKFLLLTFPPNLEGTPHEKIEQGYLFIGDGDETRVRRSTNPDGVSAFFLTQKIGTGLVRTEPEEEISEGVFTILWGLTEGRRIQKRRYHVTEALHPMTVDLYEGDLEGLVVAEAEFDTEEAAGRFEMPSWAEQEVTGVKGYGNRDLAINGWPKEDIDQANSREKVQINSEDMDRFFDVLKEIDTAREADASRRPIVVGVGGRTSAGKTTAVIAKIQEQFPDRVGVISTDDFAKGAEFVEKVLDDGGEINYDHPDYYDTGLAREKILDLIDGAKSVEIPVFNFQKGRGEPDGTQQFDARDIVVVEGLYALSTDLQDLFDMKAFVDISQHGSIIRRLLRDIHRTNMTPRQILRYYLDVVDPMYKKYIAPTREDADFVINNEYDPNTESSRSGTFEAQIKFRTQISDAILHKTGAQFIAATRQKDIYFDFDKDTHGSGESLRVRNEGGEYVLAYKGPVEKSNGTRLRNRFEAKISEDDAEVIIGASHTIKEIRKNRRVFWADNILVMIDQVVKIEDGEEIDLGDFVEFQLSSGVTPDEIAACATKFGIDPGSQIDISYSEM